MKLIRFNIPPNTGNEIQYVTDSIKSNHFSGDGLYTKKCQDWFEKSFINSRVLLTSSGTHSLEMIAILLNIQPGDEVIMPSYTFVSTANAFALRGAKIIFIDIRPDTMNIDETKIESAITEFTKAIVMVHYAGISCEVDSIMKIASRFNLFVVEDAAHALMCSYKSKRLGSFGHLSAFSFHETKNFTSAGEGGMLVVNDKDLIEKAEIIREKGTNRSLFFKGVVDKYTWIDIGSSYLMSDVSAAYLWGNLENAEKIKSSRLSAWNRYNNNLKDLANNNFIQLSYIPEKINHDAHMFYIKVKDDSERTRLLSFLRNNNVNAVFHYIPLHSSPGGLKYSRFHGEDVYTSSESKKLIRLPLYYGITNKNIDIVCNLVKSFYNFK